MAFVTPVMEHWLEWEIAQWDHGEESIRRPIAPWSYISLPDIKEAGRGSMFLQNIPNLAV